MKLPTFYISFGVIENTEKTREYAQWFMSVLRSKLTDVCVLSGCMPVEDVFGLAWRPCMPCDGLLVIPLFPPCRRIRYEIIEAKSAATREMRPVPVLVIAPPQLNGPPADYSLICLGVRAEEYEFRVEPYEERGFEEIAHDRFLDFLNRHPIPE